MFPITEFTWSSDRLLKIKCFIRAFLMRALSAEFLFFMVIIAFSASGHSSSMATARFRTFSFLLLFRITGVCGWIEAAGEELGESTVDLGLCLVGCDPDFLDYVHTQFPIFMLLLIISDRGLKYG